MKIRNGFVSNSSSSSFIICVPKNFLTDEDVRGKIKESAFQGKNIIDGWSHDKPFETRKLIDIFLREVTQAVDRADTIDMDCDVIQEFVSNAQGYEVWQRLNNKHFPKWEDRRDPARKEAYDKEWADIETQAEIDAQNNLDRLRAENPDSHVVVIEFSDNDGSYHSWLEHGKVVQAVFPGAIQVSHH